MSAIDAIPNTAGDVRPNCQEDAAPKALSRRKALSIAAMLGGGMALGSGVAVQAGPAATDQPSETEGLGTVWWVELVAANDAKSTAFYNTTVGWTSKRIGLSDTGKAPGPDEAAYTLFMASGNDVAGASRADPSDPVKKQPMWIVYFQVDNVEKAISRATTQGGRVLISPYDVPGSARMALLADIDGVPFGVATPL